MAGGDQHDDVTGGRMVAAILTPDQRVRVFVSSTMEELASERVAVRDAVERLRLSPVLFELGAQAHPPRSLYRSYLEQSHVFVGIYWERYGWVAPTMGVSGLEDEYLLAGAKPKLMYVKRPAPGRDPRLDELLDRIRDDDAVSYKAFDDAAELESLVVNDLSLLLSEAFLYETAPAAANHPHFTLPGDATPFVGRDAEVDELRSLLARDDVRLVTLTGPGGIGKTRLALRVAARVASEFEEGAAFVSLTSLSDERQVVSTIATAIGLRDPSGTTVETLAADLATRSVLLVLDNFEHVIGAADVVAALLSAAPQLTIVATSREALRIQAERDFPVPPMAQTDGARMFVERAASVRPDLVLDDETVARICRRLEGIPLAIELAAARVKVLSPDALLERLEHRLDFLAGGPRDLPERHRALRNAIEWSHDLLDEPERRLFAVLGAFTGSFSLGAAEAIAGRALDGGNDVLDLLASLVDKSLLRVEPTSGEPRFRMLSMISEFARARLAEQDDADRIGEAHADFFRQVAVDVGRGVRGGGDQRHWLAVLGNDDGGEAGNVRAALEWFLSHSRIDELEDMVWSLWVPAWVNGRIDEGRRITQAALDVDVEVSTRARARLLAVLGMFHMWGGDLEAAGNALRAGAELAQGLADEEVTAATTLAESMIAGPNEEARAEELAREATERYRRLDDLWGQAAALNALGWLLVSQERFDGSDVFEETLSMSLAAGDEQFSALGEVNLAEYAMHQGDVERARVLLVSSVERHRSLRLMYSVAYMLDAAARLAALTDHARRASRLIGAATRLRDSAGVSVWGSQLERRERFVEGLRATLGDDEFAKELAAGSALCYADAVAEAVPGD
jgi:predicted ATPase